MKRTPSVNLAPLTNSRGDMFDLSWSKWEDPPSADYRMYFIDVKHEIWTHTFTIFITKSKYPNEEDAKSLATTYCVNEIAKVLNNFTVENPPLVWFPFNSEGWAMV